MTHEALTRTQLRILDAVDALTHADRRWPPTLRQVAAEAGLASAGGVAYHLPALSRHVVQGPARGLLLTPLGRRAVAAKRRRRLADPGEGR